MTDTEPEETQQDDLGETLSSYLSMYCEECGYFHSNGPDAQVHLVKGSYCPECGNRFESEAKKRTYNEEYELL